VREFLSRVAVEARGVTRARVSTGCPWEDFVPTTIQFSPAADSAGVELTTDVDFLPKPRFVTGIKVVRAARRFPGTRILHVAVRSFLVQLALADEREARSAHLESTGYPLRVISSWCVPTGPVYERLTQRERHRLAFIPLDEQVALAAVLVADGRPVAAFSSDSRWPRHPLLLEVAHRLGCRIVRRPLAGIPEAIRRHIRFVRYHREGVAP